MFSNLTLTIFFLCAIRHILCWMYKLNSGIKVTWISAENQSDSVIIAIFLSSSAGRNRH